MNPSPILIGITGRAGSGKTLFGAMLTKALSPAQPAHTHDFNAENIGFCANTATATKPSIDIATYALASPIKNIINCIFNWDERHSEGYLKETVVTVLIPPPAHLAAAVEEYMQDVTLAEIEEAETYFYDEILNVFDDDSGTALSISPRQAYQIYGTQIWRSVRDSIWLDQAKALYNNGSSLIVTDVRFANEADYIREHGTLFHVERTAAATVAEHVSEDGIEPDEGDVMIFNNGTLQELQTMAIQHAKGFTNAPLTKLWG